MTLCRPWAGCMQAALQHCTGRVQRAELGAMAYILRGMRQLLSLLPASLNESQQLLGAVSGARHDRNQQLQ